MNSLQQKLQQLRLSEISRQLEPFLAAAALKNFSLTEALEALIDLELESRHASSVQRRFKLSRLRAQYSIDSFLFSHHKSRMAAKNAFFGGSISTSSPKEPTSY
jgi:DNA replication protein DnaC